MRFWQGDCQSDAVSFSGHPVEGYITSMCPLPADVMVGHLVEAVADRLAHCQVVRLSFVIDKYLMETNSESIQISYFSSSFHPLMLVFVDDSAYNNYYCDACRMVIFYFHNVKNFS